MILTCEFRNFFARQQTMTSSWYHLRAAVGSIVAARRYCDGEQPLAGDAVSSASVRVADECWEDVELLTAAECQKERFFGRADGAGHAELASPPHLADLRGQQWRERPRWHNDTGWMRLWLGWLIGYGLGDGVVRKGHVEGTPSRRHLSTMLPLSVIRQSRKTEQSSAPVAHSG
jgi:hypothetical protein